MIYNNVLKGVVPRLAEHLLPNGSAVKALNCNLEDGELKPWPLPKAVCSYTNSWNVNSLYPLEDPVDPADVAPCINQVLGFKGKADVVHCSITDLYIKLEDHVLYAATKEEAIYGQWDSLAVERPTVPPIIIPQDSPQPTSNKPCKVAYFYTLVNQHGFEGPPSPLAEGNFSIDRNFSGFNEGWNRVEIYNHSHLNLSSVRLYRSETGYRTGEEGASMNDTAFFLIAELSPNDSVFNDAYNTNSTIMYEEGINFRPPEHLENLIMLDNGSLAGSYENRLYFSAPPSLKPMYNAWPGDKDLLLDRNILGLVDMGSGIFVLTDGEPYFVSQSSLDTGYMYQENKANFSAPLASKGSVAKIAEGLLYMSTKGIVQLTLPTRGQGFAVAVISHNHFSRKQWGALNLDDAQAVALDGKYIFLTDGAGYVFFYGSGTDPIGEPYVPMSELTLLGHPRDMFVDRDGMIYYLERSGESLYQWDMQSEDYAPYEYWSKPYEMKSCTTLTAGKIHVHDTGSLDFSLVTFDCGNAMIRKELAIMKCSPFRLPSNYRADFFGYRLTGTRTVTSMHLARGMTGLAKLPGENL